MGSGINNKINEFLCKPKNVKKRRNPRLEKCYSHVNIATAKIFLRFSVKKGHLSKTQVEGDSTTKDHPTQIKLAKTTLKRGSYSSNLTSPGAPLIKPFISISYAEYDVCQIWSLNI